MISEHLEIYRRIRACSLDGHAGSLTFARRLARENRWTGDYAERVIEEYRRFALLAVSAGHAVSPSDPVDQAWHLHLQYSRTYWEEFCPKVLGKPLHHEPSRGGMAEQGKLQEWYERTLASYQRIFGEVPPPDIWPDPADRFARDPNFARITPRDYWLIRKPSISIIQLLRQPLHGGVLSATLLPGLAAEPEFGAGPEMLQGFSLVSWSSCWVAAVVALFAVLVWRSRRLMSAAQRLRPPALPDRYQAAYLAEGPGRTLETAVLYLIRQDYLAADTASGHLNVTRPADATCHPLEAALLEKTAEGTTLAQLWRHRDVATASIHGQLLESGLLIDPAHFRKARRITAPLTALAMAAGTWCLSLEFLCAVDPATRLWFSAIVAGLSWNVLRHAPRRSVLGNDLYPKLRQNPVDDTEEGRWLSFAAFGVQALDDKPLRDLHRSLFEPLRKSENGSDGGCGSGGCGGGGCGGGCGGGGC